MAASRSSPGPIATSTSSGNSGGCSTTLSPSGGPRRGHPPPRRPRPRAAPMASLRDLVRTILPLAWPAGGTILDPARGEREVTWVRVLKARVPAFDALEAGDLAIIPGPALAVVAPGLTQTDELAAALAPAKVPAGLLADAGGG